VATSKNFDVAALGEAMLEFNQTERDQLHYLQGFGGDTSNVAIAAARAGARAAYISRIGADAFGDRLLELWATEAVDTQAIERDTVAPTGIYFVTHGASGHEFSYLRAGSAASCMTPDWLLQGPASPTISSAKFLHVSAISLAISTSACDTVFAAMRLARETGTQVAFDSNLRLKLWPLDRARACIQQAVALCDLFLPSAQDVLALTGLSDPDAVADWAHGLGAPTVVLKLGIQGVLVSAQGERRRIPAHTVPLLDATGAGDCFCGNLLAQLAAGATLFDAARYANAAAALAVQGFGAVAPLPRPEQVQTLLSTAGQARL
jgi:2-dehydro-3-deoxygluconokinase